MKLTRILCWLLLTCSLGLSAADNALRFDMFLGYDNVVTDMAWFPVTFEIKNDGPTFTGRVELSESGMSSHALRSFTVELPSGTLKRFSIPMFKTEPYIREWTARLLDERGRERAETTVPLRRQIAWDGIAIGSLSRSSGGAPVLPEFRGIDPLAGPAVAKIMPDLFPDNPLTLEGLRVLYLNSERALDLKAPQVSALVAWLYGGGRLIVCLEQVRDLAGLPWLRRLLPEIPGNATESATAARVIHDFATRGWPSFPENRNNAIPSPERSSLPSELSLEPTFDQTPLSLYRLTGDGSQVTLGTPAAPLMVSAPRGRGTLSLLAFNPEREPFVGWKHRGWFWAAASGGKSWLQQHVSSYAYRTVDSAFGSIVDSTQIRKLPVGWLLILLLFYLIVIGPFDRWWLKRIKREMLTWVTFPCYVVFFSLLIYWIGYRLRAGDTEWNEIQVVDVIPMGETSHTRTRSFGAIYSPSNQRYTFDGRLPFATFRPEAALQGTRGGQLGEVAQIGHTFKASMAVPVWTSQVFVRDSSTLTNAAFSVEASGSGKQASLQVDNQTGRSVTAATVIVRGELFRLPTLPTGKTVVPLSSLKVESSLEDYVARHQSTLSSVVDNRRNAFGENRPHSDLTPQGMATASCFIGMLKSDRQYDYGRFATPPGMDLSEYARRGDTIVLAWVDQYNTFPSFNDFPVLRSHPMTLFRQIIPSTSPTRGVE